MTDSVKHFWIDRSDRERLRLGGPDRAKFLHNLCTNDIKKLEVGRGCEAFVTSPQGKTIGYLTILAADDHMTLRADPGSLDLVLPHFAKYSVFDDITLTDVRATTFEIHIAGDDAEGRLQIMGLPFPQGRELANLATNWRDHPMQIVRESPFGLAGLTVIGPTELRAVLIEALSKPSLSNEEAEGLRIEAGTPRFGQDITPENLPQEIGRDTRTISFTGGCYLGQETVARLDALGHVNKILRRIEDIAGENPLVGGEISAEGKPAGVVTSSGHTPRTGKVVALGMIKIKAAPTGQRITWKGGEGTVAALSQEP